MEDRHDSMLLEILTDQKSIKNFLETIFGFLSRRTDFYIEMKNPTDKIGFPPGFNKRLVHSAFNKFDPEFLKYREQEQTSFVPSLQNEIVVETSKDNDNTIISDEPILSNCTDNIEMETISKDEKSSTKETTETFSFQPNEYYNGSKFDMYCWSQTTSDMEIHIRLPEHIKSAKNLNVQILVDSIKVQDKISNNVIFEGKMTQKCKNNDSIWNIANGKLQISLDKIKDVLWDRLFDNEPSLDLTKVCASRFIDELPDEDQAALEKLRFDQHQKAMGKPTSNEIKNVEMLRKAWNAKGSPFKGQPFDPSVVKWS